MAVVFPHGYWTPLSTVQDREVKNLKCFIIPPFTLHVVYLKIALIIMSALFGVPQA